MTIRFKLTTVVVSIIVVANSLLSFLTFQYLGRIWLGEVQTRVQRNLNAARAAYQSQMELINEFLLGATRDYRLARALPDAKAADFEEVLRGLDALKKMDFIVLLDPEGKVTSRARSSRKGDDLSSDPLVARVRQERRAVTGTVICSQARLEAEGGDLAQRARFDLIPTPAARPTAELVRTNGMVVAAAVPVLDRQGAMVGILYGGNLVNRRYEIVDAIKQQVFPEEHYDGKEIGTVTIFQDDLRVSTNVKMEDGSRAVGTRLSASVCEAVLDRGGQWAAPAFVVNDWYITAYEPIHDPGGRIVGALYVGLLQSPFIYQLNVIRGGFLAIILGATLASLVLLFLATELVLRPIRKVVLMAQKVIGGDLSARVGIRPPGEMGTLCWAVDSMAQAVYEREEMVKLMARQQVGRSEQLASVGRLAAGVAHEINNPLTGVLAFADMLREKENMDDQDREDLELIIRETKRAREIVRGLLDFARETPLRTTALAVNDLLLETTRLLGKRDAFQNVAVVEDFAEDLPPVHGDKNQLQQVFVNLCLNACEAMLDGGTLMVSSRCDGDRVVVDITDTGCGIKREHLDKIFEPFFTTKPVGKGTGLGLSVTYGIVQQHGGTMEVESQEGKGSTFRITLPTTPASP
jgi:two-component system, NtrC family, sensor kinase